MKRFFFVLILVLLLTCKVWSQEKDSADVQVLTQSSQSWDTEVLPEYPEGQPEVKVLLITVPVGAELPMHKHPVINAGVMLQGELTVITEEEETLHLKAGEAIVEVVDKWHYGKNEGDEPAELIVFYAGTTDKSITVFK
ncbi:MAG: cupin domain-containing protein [Desulfohalobiaceae bacterium]